MSKYPFEQHVDAVYTSTLATEAGNPFLEAMPEMLTKETLFSQLKSLPTPPRPANDMGIQERRRSLAHLSTLFFPMDYMYEIYTQLFCAIENAYTTSTMTDMARRIQSIHPQCISQPVFVSEAPESASILGVPGIGKTSTIRKCLRQIPQVLTHYEYQGRKFYHKQITHITVECPSDCSVKALALNIIEAIDRAVGSSYYEMACRRSHIPSASALTSRVKILCLNHSVGLIVIDEIQNAIITASRNNQSRPLIKFLVELTNEACTSIYLVGTPSAEELFISQEHLKRRTRGVRLLPMKPDTVYRDFMRCLWPYQYTEKEAPFTDQLLNLIYDQAGGIPAYIIRLFREAQTECVMSGQKRIDTASILRTVDRLSLSVPKLYIKGTSISDFSAPRYVPEEPEEPLAMDKREYAVKRGRPKAARASLDILQITEGCGRADLVLDALMEHGLVEVLQ